MNKSIENRPVMSWNTHSLISRFALSGSICDNPGQICKVSPLEHFISACSDPISTLALDFQEDLYSALGLRPYQVESSQRIECQEQFIKSFRLNPATDLRYVRVFEPEDLTTEMGHDASRDGPPGHSYIEVEHGSEMSALDIICAYADEPDWGMDQNIFSVTDYALGKPSFGPARGKSSQALFHMGFPHQNRLTYFMAPWLARSLLSKRARMCFGLSAIAFREGFGYWGWRFAAWGTHYLQDMTCPFHCCPFPSEKMSMVIKFILNPSPRKWYHLIKGHLQKRHAIFEATVSYVMNESIKKRKSHPFLRALTHNDKPLPCGLDPAIAEISAIPHLLAPQINDLMIELYTFQLIDRPTHNLDVGGEPLIGEALEEASRQRPAVMASFVEMVCHCLSEAGRVTRFALISGRSPLGM
ncbi:MAG: hypothetical protein PHS86_07615 [Syntrophaceae bacterium]|nr:hypothetical protein [Syntrophaceae bacterium]